MAAVCCKNSQRVAQHMAVCDATKFHSHSAGACCKNSQRVAQHLAACDATKSHSHSAGACYNCGSVLHNIWPRVTQRNPTLTRRERVTIAAACCKTYHISAPCCKKYQRVARTTSVLHNIWPRATTHEIQLSLGGSVLQLRQRVARTTTSATKFHSHLAAACCKNYHISAACCKNYQRVERRVPAALHNQDPGSEGTQNSARPRVHSSNSVVS
jgi:hypothetical protein